VRELHVKGAIEMTDKLIIQRLPDWSYGAFLNETDASCIAIGETEEEAWNNGMARLIENYRNRDALLQAANEAALREALSQVWDDWNAPIGDLASPYVAGTIADRITRLIPQPSALDRRLAEARLEEAEWWHEHVCDHAFMAHRVNHSNECCMACEQLAELRRAVKGESDAK
jgi:hypothetical protein